MASTPEAKCKKRIKALLDKYGAWYCMPIGTGYGNSGVPDFVGIYKGQGFTVEAKADTNPTALQQHEMDKVMAAGGVAMVVRLRKNGTEEGFALLQAFLDR